jgi:protein arginine kinase
MVSIDTSTRRGATWLSADTEGIFVSTRVRLARNLVGFSFPQWASEDSRQEVRDLVVSALTGVPAMSGGMLVRMDEISEIDREILKEERLVSSEFASGSVGSALSLSKDGNIAVMVNEEDHIRMQYIRSGVCVRDGWRALSAIDDALEQSLQFACSAKYGYLTACPTNVGTGLRVSIMMHLPGLKLMGEVDQVIKGLSCTGLQVRGILGEGSEAYGNMYQISNQITLGVTEEEILDKVERLANEVAVHERNARERMLQKRHVFVCDRVARSVAILKNCRLIPSGDALGFLSGLRLGLECGMVKGIDRNRINELIMLIHPAHLQRLEGVAVPEGRRDELRADLLRERLKNIRYAG